MVVGRRKWQGANFLAGMLIGLAVVTPVFAATEETLEPWQALLLLASVILLFAGLAIAASASAARTITPGARVTSTGSFSIQSSKLRRSNRRLFRVTTHLHHSRY